MRSWLLLLIAAVSLVTFATAQAAETLAVLAGAAGESPAPTAATSSAGKSEALDEVTIRARRAALTAKVSGFVNHIAATENAEGLPRWNEPVCPLVIGLPRQEREFILERVSEIARAAAVPLADQPCRPNLYIVVTVDPKKALEGLSYRNRMVVFGGGRANVIHDFIAKPRAVRVWYNSNMTDPFGMPPSTALGCYSSDQFCNVPVFDHADPTHLSFNRIWNFSRVFVIVDQTRWHAVSPAQFADYAAMVGLAEIRPDARLDDAETILNLFDAGAEAAPPTGMTDWDRAFLKSLYATEQRVMAQRSEMAHIMVREIAQH